MSDFYQILMREIEPRQPIGGIAGLDKESGAKNRAVDKVDDIPLCPKKKKGGGRKKINQVKKNHHEKTNRLPSIALAKEGLPSGLSSAASAREGLFLSTRYADPDSFLSTEPVNPIWLTMAEAAKLGGVQKRTVKRALRAGLIKYRIVESRYQINFRSALIYLFSKRKLWNKLKKFGIGQYVEKWKN